jgi:hypothetical protein
MGMLRMSENELQEFIQRGQKAQQAINSITRGLENPPGRAQMSRNNASLRAFQAKGRLKKGEMNNTEAAWADELERQRVAREIVWYKWHGIKLRLADNTFYEPDFLVLRTDGMLRVDEVKGFWTDDARVKIKVAADMYPFIFTAVSKRAKKDGGGWKIEEF